MVQWHLKFIGFVGYFIAQWRGSKLNPSQLGESKE